MAVKRVVLHIGTHKTGTTTLQRLLLRNAAALASAGVYVPQTGRPRNDDGTVNPAHQQIAWGLMEGTTSPLESLLAESNAANASTIVISSEELHLLHDRPQMLSQLRATLEAGGYEPTLLLYVREQAGYIESIYSEIMKGVRVASFPQIVARALSEASVEVHPQFPVPLRYSQLIRRFREAFPESRFIVRPFDASRTSAYLLDEFLATIASIHGALPREPLDSAAQRENPRLTLGEVIVQLHWFAMQLHGQVADPIAMVRRAGTTQHDPLLGQSFRPLLREERIAILETFAADNALVEDEAQIVIPASRVAELAPANDARWATARAQRAILDFVSEAWFA